MDTTAVDVSVRGATIPVRVRADDTGGPGAATRVTSATVSFTHSAGGMDETAKLTPDSGDTLLGMLRIERRARHGVWFVSMIRLEDAAGNHRNYNPAAVAAVGGPTQLVVSTDRVAAALPRIARVLSVRPSRVDAGKSRRSITIELRAQDGGDGVASVTATLRNYNGLYRAETRPIALRRVRGTRHDGVWRGSGVIPSRAWPGRWVTAARVIDRSGHESFFSEIEQAGRSVLVSGELRDATKPRLSALSMTPTTVDIRQSDQTVRFSVRVRDTGSRVDEVRLSVEHDHVENVIPMKLVSGTRADGVWQAVRTIRTCDTRPSGSWMVRARALDGRGNVSLQMAPAHLEVTAHDDRRPPRGEVSRDASGRARVSFDEDVVGVSNSSVEVTERFGQPRTGIRLGAVLIGTWTCLDVTASPVDCVAGPVRVSLFTPDPPTEATSFVVSVNPEHVLDLTDLHGNPAVSSGISSSWAS